MCTAGDTREDDCRCRKSFVKKGESTTMYFTVRGLQDMDKPSYLNVVNATPDVVTVKNGNKQKIEINAAQFNGGNEYKMNFSLQAISTGEFSLTSAWIYRKTFHR